MALTDRKIEGTTPIKDFPKKYDDLIDDIDFEINRLNLLIEQKDTEIEEMKKSFNSALNKLRAEYIAMLDTDKIPNMPDEDGNYILKARKTGDVVEYTWVRSA